MFGVDLVQNGDIKCIILGLESVCRDMDYRMIYSSTITIQTFIVAIRMVFFSNSNYLDVFQGVRT